jgi:type IV pilus assembly protein PilB
VRRGLIDREELDWALDAQRRRGMRLGSVLVGSGIVAQDDLAEALADLWGCPHLDLDATPLDPELAARFDLGRLAREHWLPVARRPDLVWVATSERPRPQVADVVRAELGNLDVDFVICSERALRIALRRLAAEG